MTVSDEELQAQIEAISDLPLEERAEALTKTAEAVRELLDSTDS
jgi:hypothetical protein